MDKSYNFEVYKGFVDLRQQSANLTDLFLGMLPDKFPSPEQLGSGTFRELRNVSKTGDFIRGITESASITFSISSKLHGAKETLPARMKIWLRELLAESPDIRSAKIQTNGNNQTVDLLKDKLKSTKTIPMLGRYPSQAAIYQALEDTYYEHAQTISDYLGDGA